MISHHVASSHASKRGHSKRKEHGCLCHLCCAAIEHQMLNLICHGCARNESKCVAVGLSETWYVFS